VVLMELSVRKKEGELGGFGFLFGVQGQPRRCCLFPRIERCHSKWWRRQLFEMICLQFKGVIHVS
jgi:hypothetical protein